MRCVVVASRGHGGHAPASARPATARPATGSTDFTWSGATPTGPGATNWSVGTNWVGNVAPSLSVGTLSFPVLTNAGCTSNPPQDACYSSNNDLTGLSANALSIDDGASYFLTGNGFTLGAGGLTASTASTAFANPPQLSMPVTLGASQTWTIDGNNVDAQLGLGGGVTGAPNALTLNLNHQTFLDVSSSDVEVGPVTITTSQTSGLNGSVALLGGKLNGTDGNSVTLTGTGTGIFIASNSTIGPLTGTGGTTQIGNGSSGAAILNVAGGVSLSSPTRLQMNIVKAGTAAGTDYSQLHATGAVSLGGGLTLLGSTSGGPPTCPTLHPGDVDTLVTTTGALTGTFSGIPDGTTMAVGCSPGSEPTVRINYTASTVTATVLTAGGAPAIKKLAPNAGPTAGGNTVTITGSGFSPGATVAFGSTASPSVTFVSSTQLKAVAPPEAAGVVAVTVTSSGVTTASTNNDLYAYGPPTVTSFTPTSGTTGSSVTITGTGFVPGAKVAFGSLMSPKVSFKSPTQLKAVVPNGATPATISVTTAAGQGTSTGTFSPTLSITGFSPTSGPATTVVTISGIGFTATSTVKFNGTPASAVVFVSSGELQATVPSGATTGPITVTNTAAPVGTVSSAGKFTVT